MARKRRRTALAGILLVTLLLLVVVRWLQTHGIAGGLYEKKVPSTLIYGTNLSLVDTNDQVVNDPATQRLLRQVHMPIIRMPFRFSLTDSYEVQALRAIQYIRAIPVVIIHGPVDPNALADDRHLIALVQSVFGTQTVYVEFGNEADNAGIDAQQYTQSWNAVVPALKAMAPTYKYVGPVNWHADPTYVATFDANATPRPDANSWHEYACYPNSSDAECLANLADWTTHIQQTNDAVRAAIGATLPIMITEWNLDGSFAPPDSRYMNPEFMRVWTARALQTLAADEPYGLVAAMQYKVTNDPSFGLVDANKMLTPEGQVFFQTLTSSA